MPIPLSRYHILWFSLFVLSALVVQNATPLLITYLLTSYIFIYLFLLLPEFIVRDVLGKVWHPIDTFFFGLGWYFFLFTPVFYFATKAGLTTLRIHDILLVSSVLILLLYSKNLIQKPIHPTTQPLSHPLQKTDVLFAVFFLAYFLLHALFFHYYQFLPEWDGYSDILSIEKNIVDQTFRQDYRAFFQASVSIMSALTHLPPYALFIYFFIPLQASIFLVLYRLFQRCPSLRLSHQFLVYLITLSIPVINMEIDMTRPQNILLIFTPLIFYLIFLYEKEKSLSSLLLLIFMLIGGVKYHEFFWLFLLALPIIFLPELIKKKTLLKNPAFLVASLSTLIILLAALFSASQTLHHFALKVLLDISDISRWRLWFLDNYNNSNQANTQVGWSGILGTLQYYGYYLSPALAVLMGGLIFSYKKILSRSFWLMQSTLYLITLLGIWFCFAEILPRLNSPFIPERYWLFFDITFIFFVLAVLLYFSKASLLLDKKPVFFLVIFCCVIGLGASLYIASAKKSFTTPDEYRAALWIQSHLPTNALIISQPANAPLIQNFGRRELYTPQENFFMDATYHPPYTIKKQEGLRRVIQRMEMNPTEQNDLALSQLRKLLADQEALQARPIYILYSEQKFANLYQSREWYQKQNFYRANIAKFRDFEQVYQNNGIILWRLQ